MVHALVGRFEVVYDDSGMYVHPTVTQFMTTDKFGCYVDDGEVCHCVDVGFKLFFLFTHIWRIQSLNSLFAFLMSRVA